MKSNKELAQDSLISVLGLDQSNESSNSFPNFLQDSVYSESVYEEEEIETSSLAQKINDFLDLSSSNNSMTSFLQNLSSENDISTLTSTHVPDKEIKRNPNIYQEKKVTEKKKNDKKKKKNGQTASNTSIDSIKSVEEQVKEAIKSIAKKSSNSLSKPTNILENMEPSKPNLSKPRRGGKISSSDSLSASSTQNEESSIVSDNSRLPAQVEELRSRPKHSFMHTDTISMPDFVPKPRPSSINSRLSLFTTNNLGSFTPSTLDTQFEEETVFSSESIAQNSVETSSYTIQSSNLPSLSRRKILPSTSPSSVSNFLQSPNSTPGMSTSSPITPPNYYSPTIIQSDELTTTTEKSETFLMAKQMVEDVSISRKPTLGTRNYSNNSSPASTFSSANPSPSTSPSYIPIPSATKVTSSIKMKEKDVENRENYKENKELEKDKEKKFMKSTRSSEQKVKTPSKSNGSSGLEPRKSHSTPRQRKQNVTTSEEDYLSNFENHISNNTTRSTYSDYEIPHHKHSIKSIENYLKSPGIKKSAVIKKDVSSKKKSKDHNDEETLSNKPNLFAQYKDENSEEEYNNNKFSNITKVSKKLNFENENYENNNSNNLEVNSYSNNSSEYDDESIAPLSTYLPKPSVFYPNDNTSKYNSNNLTSFQSSIESSNIFSVASSLTQSMVETSYYETFNKEKLSKKDSFESIPPRSKLLNHIIPNSSSKLGQAKRVKVIDEYEVSKSYSTTTTNFTVNEVNEDYEIPNKSKSLASYLENSEFSKKIMNNFNISNTYEDLHSSPEKLYTSENNFMSPNFTCLSDMAINTPSGQNDTIDSIHYETHTPNQFEDTFATGLETTFTIDQSLMTKNSFMLDSPINTPSKKNKKKGSKKHAAELSVKSKKRDSSDFGVKEVTFDSIPGETTSIVMTFRNHKKKITPIKSHTVFLHRDELVQYCPYHKNLSKSSCFQTISESDEDSFLKELDSNDNIFSVYPTDAIMQPGETVQIVVTFSPKTDGIFSGAIKIRVGKKTITIVLRGESKKVVTCSELSNDNPSFNLNKNSLTENSNNQAFEVDLYSNHTNNTQMIDIRKSSNNKNIFNSDSFNFDHSDNQIKNNDEMTSIEKFTSPFKKSVEVSESPQSVVSQKLKLLQVKIDEISKKSQSPINQSELDISNNSENVSVKSSVSTMTSLLLFNSIQETLTFKLQEIPATCLARISASVPSILISTYLACVSPEDNYNIKVKLNELNKSQISKFNDLYNKSSSENSFYLGRIDINYEGYNSISIPVHLSRHLVENIIDKHSQETLKNHLPSDESTLASTPSLFDYGLKNNSPIKTVIKSNLTSPLSSSSSNITSNKVQSTTKRVNTLDQLITSSQQNSLSQNIQQNNLNHSTSDSNYSHDIIAYTEALTYGNENVSLISSNLKDFQQKVSSSAIPTSTYSSIPYTTSKFETIKESTSTSIISSNTSHLTNPYIYSSPIKDLNNLLKLNTQELINSVNTKASTYSGSNLSSLSLKTPSLPQIYFRVSSYQFQNNSSLNKMIKEKIQLCNRFNTTLVIVNFNYPSSYKEKMNYNFYSMSKKLILNGKSFVNLPIHFIAQEKGKFEATLVVRLADNPEEILTTLPVSAICN